MKCAALSAILAAALANPVAAQDLVRHSTGKFPIASAIEVPPGYTTIYLSGMGADIADKTATPMTLAAYGDTETQVRSALTKIQESLATLHLSFADVVQMHIYMVADPKLGHLDFAGMMKAYTQFFGTPAQPNLPTRSAFQVAGLANPGWLVEIEVTAVRK
ncbi:RidA family protein [Lichenicola sp.]|uniref:RidA family protein n=1 Tax=Lichenicola sp. TaxID=2804529 RepID=UPI003B00177B